MSQFWKNRSNQSFDNPIQYNNLTSNLDEAIAKHYLESQLIQSKLSPYQYNRILDLGSGNGQWFPLLEPLCNEYHCVDPYISPIPEIMSNKKVSYYNLDCIDFSSSLKFDLVFISGLLLYLSDSSLSHLLSQVINYVQPQSILFMREPIGVNNRFVLNNHFSSELNAYYSAIYRSYSEFLSIFDSFGFKIVDSGWVHHDGSIHNKRLETRLSFFKFAMS